MPAAPLLAWIDWGWWFGSPLTWLFAAVHLWMLIDAFRRREWGWMAFLLIFPGLGTFWYFLQVFRSGSSATQGFELPGAHQRQRIKELKAQIHHLDKAHHHFQLGDVYFRQGKLAQAEASYRASLERDGTDIDARAHLGQALLRQNRAAEARPLLEAVCAENPKHDYGHSLMALAETLSALGEQARAMAIWEQVVAGNSYPRAKVQLAALYLAAGRRDDARREVDEVLADDPHTPGFQRRRDRVWVAQARKLRRQL